MSPKKPNRASRLERIPTDSKAGPLAALPIEFTGSFPSARQQLDPPLPEIAFLGRSNVGKSSLINALVGRRIAKTSGTPGKTQHLNVFRFPAFYLIDLPGYGFAKLSHSERLRLKALVRDTVTVRPGLGTVVWLLDIRHPPSAEDLTMAEVLADAKRGAIVALTKADKLSRAQQLTAARARAEDLGIQVDDLHITSAAKGGGIAALGEAIIEALTP